MKNIFTLLFFFLFVTTIAIAGNPDRKGAAGAGELLMNPWARSAGLHTINTSGISGIEATRLNIAGLARIEKTEISLSHSKYLVGTGLSMSSLGIAQKVGKRGVFGLDVMVIGFGDIRVTTTDQPEGTGATYTPTWANMALSYATTFENKVSVGLSARFVIENVGDIRASGMALDGGVQYVNGPKDNFKLGLAIRNLGTPMKFKGEGFTKLKSVETYNLAYDQRAANYELPVTLNIGTSYDFYFSDEIRFTPIANFTSNSFSQDQIGVGIELGIFEEMLQVRGAYKFPIQKATLVEDKDIYSGLALGASVNLPLGRDSNNKFSIDYAYRTTRVFNGTHNLGIRVNLNESKS